MSEKAEIFIKGGEELERSGKFINPNVTDLRKWDANLLGKFKPKYYSSIQQCQFCAFGPCDLSKNRRGACGMRLNPQMAREALVMAIAGSSSFIARACELNETIIKEHTYFAALNSDANSTIFINLLCGYKPETTGDLKKALRYANEQIVHLISATHMGQEPSDFDFNSKIFHAGMLSLLAMEIYEILKKISGKNEGVDTNKSDTESGAADKNKGVVLIIGEHVPNIDKFDSDTAFEIFEINTGNASDFYNKINESNVVVIGEGNVRTDIIEKAKKSSIPVIAASDRNLAGLADLSCLSADKIFKKLISKEISGCYIKDGEKLADVVKMCALGKKETDKNSGIMPCADVIKKTEECINCGPCSKACPVNLNNRLLIDKTTSTESRNADADAFTLEENDILIVLGDANFPNGAQELAEILEEFLNRNFLIFAAGDVVISIAESALFEKHKNLINMGSLSAGIHIIEKVIETAGKNPGKSPAGNFDEIAEDIANRVGLVAVFWGASTQENFAVSQGLMRMGIPVIFGQQGIKYRRELRGDIIIDYSRDDYNGNYNEVLKKISPKNLSFPHLCIAAKTKEEAMLLIPKMVFRNFDSEDVRRKKISRYIEIYRKYAADKTKEIPDDIKNFVRSEKDIPEAYKNSIQK
ncbi:MAG: hypothetical protein GW779_03825 [Candidatus Altiarchaeum hamiconexum]|uniref:4Fe-4S ferredoxin-type domain-containing protein n=1 Tax=Candidatus Altarchaeum hamiconexum TaxID=1803513 RepID=A0A8J7YYW5_9ARCH|nr:hypothetical protein [Candidatus Altarchaeum hamiconexum]OIQ05131.1 MAG: hypothetical protein AUK59_05040 [Candidatus Altarchaeum sp. CG2_30_32_3053]PIN67056.1 MAG: hypothetical protein COV98_04990 [Candidatus Altarchaeum sp. CG12_big_fil_rev_8_21_14_0_65_33_22]PIX48727.1 MAG: hypothetical protein COZ53_03120 [Candidatus Altarchaeum sp. CG_4_8_14_3_um_filter_33_2054]PIZ29824.1 MAG: hypothetical protein COY41_05035 [Candidatus Altarchaeum sp. CG_4_10_14_0_8_um_filter_32_851]